MESIAYMSAVSYAETFMRLSPRQLALAVGVSESSLKRWADAGKLRVSRTDGGHRRIAMTEAVRFIRDAGLTVVRPDLLGLGGGDRRRRPADKALETDARAIRAQLVGRFLGGESIAALADGPIAAALARLDAQGDRDPKSEALARVATDAWAHAIAALRGLCDVAADAPVALGGARASSPAAALRSAVVAAALAGEGMRVLDLGASLDAAVLRAAVTAHRPALTWQVDGPTIDISGHRLRTTAEVAAFARGLRSRA